MKISASIIATSLTSLSKTLPEYDKNLIDYIHLDIMDGNYVPQITFGEGLSKEISKLTDIPLDVHLMVSNPEREVPKYYSIRPEFLTFHAETTHFMVRLCEEIRSHGIRPGISLNPSTPLESIIHILPYVDLVLLMTVDPGFYGQSFFRGGFDKIKKAKDILSTCSNPILLEIDGGVNAENISELSDLGVDICVTGSALYKNGYPNVSAKELKQLTYRMA